MLQQMFGSFVGGVLWGLGVTLAASIVRGEDDGVRSLTKGAVKTYLTAADRLQTTAEEMRATFDSLVAEVETELSAEHPAEGPEPPQPSS